MPVCPNCGKEIDELIVYCRERSKYRVWADEDEYLSWERIDAINSEQDGSYVCPECGAELFQTYSEAVAFLKGKTIRE